MTPLVRLWKTHLQMGGFSTKTRPHTPLVSTKKVVTRSSLEFDIGKCPCSTLIISLHAISWAGLSPENLFMVQSILPGINHSDINKTEGKVANVFLCEINCSAIVLVALFSPVLGFSHFFLYVRCQLLLVALAKRAKTMKDLRITRMVTPWPWVWKHRVYLHDICTALLPPPARPYSYSSLPAFSKGVRTFLVVAMWILFRLAP